jgi:hypothetical protein
VKNIFKNDIVLRIVGVLMVMVGSSYFTLYVKDFIEQKKNSAELIEYQKIFGCPRPERQIGIYEYEEERVVNVGNYFSIILPVFLEETEFTMKKDSEAIFSQAFAFKGDTTIPENYNYVSFSIYPVSANYKIRSRYQGRFTVNPDKTSMTLEDLSGGKIENGEKYLDFLSNYKDPENVSTYVINESDGGQSSVTYVVVNKLKDIVIVMSVGTGRCFEKETRYDHLVRKIEFL